MVRSSSRLYRASHSDEVDSSMCPVSLSTPRFPLFYSFVGGLNLLLMFLRVFRDKGNSLQARWDALGRVAGSLFVDMDLVDPFLLFSLGILGFLPDLHGFYKWVFDCIELLNGFLQSSCHFSRRDDWVSGSGPGLASGRI